MAWNDRRPFLEAKAIRLDLSLGVGHIDPFEAATRLGVQVVAAPFGQAAAVEGMYLRRKGRGFIFVNASKPYRRQRMTCAHEIGHHVLLADDEDVEVIEGAVSVEGRGGGHEERDAFLFASELLMPEHGVRQLVHGIIDPEESITAVVREYDASPQAAAIRLAELNLVDRSACTAFLDSMKDLATWRAFVQRHHINVRGGSRQGRLRLPRGYLDRTRRLHDAGVLSEERYRELLDRDLPTSAV